MRVVDGATGAERYTLRAPDGEMGFGEHAAIVSDCDVDSRPDIAVWSWLDEVGGPSSALMLLRIRVFAGAKGDLIGLLETVREVGTPALLSDFDVVIAADANLDSVLDAADVIEASTALATDPSLSPNLDCKPDGALTIEDFTTVIVRVLEEPQAQRVALHSLALRSLEIVEPIAPPGSEIDPSQIGGGSAGESGCASGWQGGWDCWTDLFVILADFGWMAARMARCAGPLATICIIELICQLSRIIASLIEFADECFTCGGTLPWWIEGIVNVTQAIGIVCEGLQALSLEWQVKITKAIRDLLRGLGRLRL